MELRRFTNTIVIAVIVISVIAFVKLAITGDWSEFLTHLFSAGAFVLTWYMTKKDEPPPEEPPKKKKRKKGR